MTCRGGRHARGMLRTPGLRPAQQAHEHAENQSALDLDDLLVFIPEAFATTDLGAAKKQDNDNDDENGADEADPGSVHVVRFRPAQRLQCSARRAPGHPTKNDVSERRSALAHIGLLTDEPPATGGLPLIKSSEELRSDWRRHPKSRIQSAACKEYIPADVKGAYFPSLAKRGSICTWRCADLAAAGKTVQVADPNRRQDVATE